MHFAQDAPTTILGLRWEWSASVVGQRLHGRPQPGQPRVVCEGLPRLPAVGSLFRLRSTPLRVRRVRCRQLSTPDESPWTRGRRCQNWRTKRWPAYCDPMIDGVGPESAANATAPSIHSRTHFRLGPPRHRVVMTTAVLAAPRRPSSPVVCHSALQNQPPNRRIDQPVPNKHSSLAKSSYTISRRDLWRGRMRRNTHSGGGMNSAHKWLH